MTLSLACLEKRFAFAVPLVAQMDLAVLVSDAPVLAKMRHHLKSFGWRKKHSDDFVRGVGRYELRPKLPADRVPPRKIASSVRASSASCGGAGQKPAIHLYPTSHMGFLTHLPEVLGVMREFIEPQAKVGQHRCVDD